MIIGRKLLYPAPLILAALFAGINWTYWPLVLKSGALPPESDSVAIPMFSGLLFSPALALLLAVWSVPALYRSPDQIDWLATGKGRRAIVGSILYGSAGLAGVIAAISVFATNAPVIDALWLLWLVPFIVWNLLLRAAFVQRSIKQDG